MCIQNLLTRLSSIFLLPVHISAERLDDTSFKAQAVAARIFVGYGTSWLHA